MVLFSSVPSKPGPLQMFRDCFKNKKVGDWMDGWVDGWMTGLQTSGRVQESKLRGTKDQICQPGGFSSGGILHLF